MRAVFREFRRIHAAYDSYDRDGGNLMAAAAAYFIGLSLFPLLWVLIACVGWVLEYTSPGQNAEQQVMVTVEHHVSPVVGLQVRDMLAQLREKSSVSGPVGFVTLLVTALAGFSQFQQAFDRIWNVAPRASRGVLGTLRYLLVERLIAFVMLLAIGGIIVLTFISATLMATIQARTRDVLPAPDAVWTAAQTGASVLINIGAFTLLYRWLPRVHVRWADAFRGAVIVSAAWEVGRQLLAAFLIGTHYSSAYGVVGTFIGVLVWCYYACIVLFIGAEYVQGLVEARRVDAVES